MSATIGVGFKAVQRSEDGVVSSVMLVCGVLLSLALGVLIAYGICLGMFAIFRMHARQVAAARAPKGVPARLGTLGG